MMCKILFLFFVAVASARQVTYQARGQQHGEMGYQGPSAQNSIFPDVKIDYDEIKEQFLDVITNMCKQNGAEDKVAAVEEAVTDYFKCIGNPPNADVKEIVKEVMDAKKEGKLGDYFKRDCAETVDMTTCDNTLVSKITPCVPDNMKNFMTTILKLSSNTIDYACFNEGERMTSFFAEGGVECIQLKMEELVRNCSTAFVNFISSLIGKTQNTCNYFSSLSSCIVNKLEGCSTPAPAKKVQNFLKYIQDTMEKEVCAGIFSLNEEQV